MLTHKKDRGTLGELAVAKLLVQHGFPVFTAFGDNSRVDIIALVGRRPLRIQVKTVAPKDGAILVSARKCGPRGYVYYYHPDDFDVFAVYLEEQDRVLWIPLSDVLMNRSNEIRLRLTPARNNQKINTRKARDYTSFSRAVKRQWGI